MENLVEILHKEQEYDLFIDLLPDVIQDILMAGYAGEDGEWHKFEWSQDVPWLLANIRASFQELQKVIKTEKSRLKV